MRYFLRRAGFFLATLWAAVTLNFLIPRLQPGDPAEAIVSRLPAESRPVDPAQVQAVRKMLGAPDGNLLSAVLATTWARVAAAATSASRTRTSRTR